MEVTVSLEIRIESADERSYIEIGVDHAYCFDTQSGQHDDSWNANVSIQMSTDWFTATVGDIDLYRSFIDVFIASLREYNISRKGAVSLEGLGYGRFELSIYSTNERGYSALSLSLEKYDLASERHTVKATASFDLDPGDIPGILADFERVFSKERLAQEFGGSVSEARP